MLRASRRRLAAVLGAAATAVVLVAGPSVASDPAVGSLVSSGFTMLNQPVSGTSFVQSADDGGSSYTPASPLSVRSWSTGAYTDPGGTLALEIWRPVPGTNTVTLVYRGAQQPADSAAGLWNIALATSFTMQPGDRPGLHMTGSARLYRASPSQSDFASVLSNTIDTVTGDHHVGDTAGYARALGPGPAWFGRLNVGLFQAVDTPAPVITPTVTPAAPDGSNGWYTSSPTVHFDVTADQSAVTSTTGCDDATVTSDTAGRTFTCSATSAGGTATSTPLSIKRDATDPTVSFGIGGVADGAGYYPFQLPGAPSCAVTDALSGPAGCAVTGYSAVPGTHTLTATGTDNAGNAAVPVTRTYTVLAPWTVTGFNSPVNMGGVVNTVKGGSTVPVKFSAKDGTSVPVTDPTTVGTFSTARVSCSSTVSTDPVEITSTGATSLRYDATAGQFIYNWQTPKTPGTCYKLTLTTADGTPTNALFQLK